MPDTPSARRFLALIICMMVWGLCAAIQFTTVREKLDSLQNQVTHLQESLKGDLCEKVTP